MISSSAGRRSPAAPWLGIRAPAGELLVQAALVAVAWLLVGLLEGETLPTQALGSLPVLGTLGFAAGVAAALLLAVAAWTRGDRRARRVAAAVGIYTGSTFLLHTVEVSARDGLWMLSGSIATLGVVGLLALSVRTSADRRRDRRAALVVLVVVLVAASAVAAIGLLLPDRDLPTGVVAAADLVAWSGAGAAGVLLVLAGIVAQRPVLRRAGLAFATLGVANAVRIADAGPSDGPPVVAAALELAAVVMLLVAAVPYLVDAVRAVSRQQETSWSRIAEAEAVMAGVAERDHELRNLVAGLSGAARVLTEDEAAASADGRRLLVAAGAELERLQRMLDGDTPEGPPDADVGRVLTDLALVHLAGGTDVRVEIDTELHVAVDPGVLAQVLTNLLVNCSRHAPGARVRLRARARGVEVRIEVVDDGPGLPPGATDALLRRGVPGARPAGAGLGLALSAELVERHRGTFTVVSGARGCTAVLDLPMAGHVAAARV